VLGHGDATAEPGVADRAIAISTSRNASGVRSRHFRSTFTET
jgi:hypothetical protein